MSVYAWGANSHGQLGLGYESEMCTSPQPVRKCSFNPTQVRCIRGGGGHVLVLDNNGRLHACGWNNRGQLGLDSTEECHSEFECIPGVFFNEAAVEVIACGWDISGCITTGKRLFVWGSNSYQQLGICQRGFTAVRRPFPVILPRDEGARRISFGMRHCAILTEEYKIYIFGRLRITEPTPTEVVITHTTLNRADVMKVVALTPAENRLASITSGQNHLLMKVIDLQHGNSRRIIALGDNKYGQSNGCRFEKDVKQITVGWTQNAVLLKDDRVFIWGRNCYGQLGLGQITDCQAMPVQLKLPENVVAARLQMGSEHGLLRSTTGDIYTWGWNEHGNCGNGDTENLCTPTPVELPTPCKIAGVGAGFCIVICESEVAA